MRISIGVPYDLAHPERNGFMTAYRDLERALSRHETTVFSPGGGDVRLGADAPAARGLMGQYRNTMALAREFAKKAGSAKPDAVLAFTGMGRFLERGHVYYTSNVPYKAVARLVEGEYPRTAHFGRLLRYYRFVAGKEAEFYKRAERIIVLSEKIRELITLEHGIDRGKIAYVPRPIPRLSAPAERGEGKAKIVFMPAELRVMKGIRRAIEAMKLLRKSEPEAVLVIRGRVNGYEKAYVERLLAEARGKANIVVTGYMPKDMLYSFMRAADCAFMPFCFDECPIALRECVGNCLPVVTNEYAGYGRGVIESFGHCAEDNDVEGYAEALAKMLGERRYNMRKRRGCMDAAGRFTFGRYEEAVNGVFGGS